MPAAVAPRKTVKKTSKVHKKNGKGSFPMEEDFSAGIKNKRKKNRVVYSDFDVSLFKKGTKQGVLTVDVAKELVGWTDTVPKNVEPLLKDRKDTPILCSHNTDNRPYVPSLAHDWMLEILRGKWRLNGETIIVDRTGMVQDGQHRLIGLILAAQERELHSEQWSQYWKSEPYIEALVVTGVMEDDDTINSIGVSKPRNRVDVIFRSELLSDIVERSNRKRVSSILAYAVKLLWERTAANIGPFRLVPKRSHSGFLDFVARHPKVEECARLIWQMDKPDRKIGRYVPLGIASGMLYLMGACQSDQEEYDKVNSEEAVVWDTWKEAVAFWQALANGAQAVKPLAEKLLKTDATGVIGSGETKGMLCKAWNLYLDKVPITDDDITVLITTDDYDQPQLAEHPRVGGIDVGEHTEVEGDD